MSRTDAGNSPRRGAGRQFQKLPGRRLLVAGGALLVVPVLLLLFEENGIPFVGLESHEWITLAALAVVRLAVFVKSGFTLVPLLDLPLLGFIFVATGGEESPLDPALFFVYALLALYLGRAPRRRQSIAYTTLFLLGFIAMYGIVVVHDYRDTRTKIAQARRDLDDQAEEIQPAIDSAAFERSSTDVVFQNVRRRVDADRRESALVANSIYFQRVDDPHVNPTPDSFDGGYEAVAEDLERRSSALLAVKPKIGGEMNGATAATIQRELEQAFRETDDRMYLVFRALTAATDDLANHAGEESSADSTIPATYGDLIFNELFHNLASIKAQQKDVKEALDKYLDSVAKRAALEDDYRSRLRRTVIERLAIAALVLAMLSLVGGLRWRFETEVRQREQARAEIEVEAEEREKENWIALTAGLTHTIGNDILAYDAYAEEALDALAAYSAKNGAVPPVIDKNLRFIHESNKARLRFIKFLDEFARARKNVLGHSGAKPEGLQQIPIEPMLRHVRAQVGRTEVADLPRDSSDPQVAAQVKKFTELPLEVAFASEAPDDRVISRGKRGVLEFFCYELFKNSLRNCSGERPLRVEVEKDGGRVRLSFRNDLAVSEVKKDGRVLYALPRSSNAEPCSDDELKTRVLEILAHCFEPGRGGGTGLGLFLIRYFAREYYSGSVSVKLVDWSTRTVAFELDLPDDLETALKPIEART